MYQCLRPCVRYYNRASQCIAAYAYDAHPHPYIEAVLLRMFVFPIFCASYADCKAKGRVRLYRFPRR